MEKVGSAFENWNDIAAYFYRTLRNNWVLNKKLIQTVKRASYLGLIKVI